MKSTILVLATLTIFAASAFAAPENAPNPAPVGEIEQKSEPPDFLQNFKVRNLGPTVGGGRVSAVAGIPGDPNVYYVGAAGGGIFKTVDGGNSWKAIFEK